LQFLASGWFYGLMSWFKKEKELNQAIRT
jgi:hypothetical protein